jgi:exodeoxyribonuclease V alpha subunit
LQTVNNYTAARFISEDSIEEDHDDPQVHTFIANGETGRIKKIYDKYQKVIIEFPNSIVIYDYEEMKGVDLGYSITIHKSQGSSSKYVILLSSSSHTYMLNNNLLYTGITRTKHKCIHIGEVKTVNRAVRIKEENNRKTNMFYLLNNIERN